MKLCLFVILILISSLASANFEKLFVQNLDFEYHSPHGTGTVEKVGIGLGLAPEAYSVDILRTNDSFEITSPYVDFSWKRPLEFFYELEQFTAKKTTASIGSSKTHFIDSEYFMVRPKGRGTYKAFQIRGKCEGLTRGTFHVRLLDDCRSKLELTIKKIEVPTDFVFHKLTEALPVGEISEEKIPAEHVVANIENGGFYLQLYFKFWISAGLRTWGHVQYENDYKTIAIRVDQIKYGYLPVTTLVMKKLKEIIKNPNVIIDPPWIRINVEDMQ